MVRARSFFVACVSIQNIIMGMEGFLKASGLCRRYKAKVPNGGENVGNLFER